MAVDYSKFNFSTPSSTTAQAETTDVVQQATSPLPSLDPTFTSLDPKSFKTPDQYAIAEREQQDQQLKDLEQRRSEFIPLANQRYGIDPELGRNELNYRQLNEQLKNDGLSTFQVREVQQQWIRSAERFRDRLPDGERKDKIARQIEEIKNIPITMQESSVGGRVAEAWKTNIPAVEAQGERFMNATAQRLPVVGLSDEEILAKYDPKLLEEVNSAGGLSHLHKIGMGSNIDPNQDSWGVGGMLTFSSTDKERELGKKLISALDRYRAEETISREDRQGEVVTLPNGEKKFMTNRQASAYYDQQESSIVGRKEYLKRFEENPLGAFKSFDDLLNFGQTSLGSTIRQAPLVAAGTAAMFVHPLAGLAIMNSGNLTDQELTAVNTVINDEYKKRFGKDADVTALSADDYIKFSSELANEGLISEASAKGLTTGALMTVAETLTGGGR